jgi:hypothetical protein
MDEATQILEHTINKAKMGERERLDAIKRLRALDRSIIDKST